MYTLLFARQFGKQLKKIPKHEQEKIVESLERIQDTPRVYCSKIESTNPPIYRLRIGNYRVFLTIEADQKTIIVTDVRRRTNQTYRHIS